MDLVVVDVDPQVRLIPGVPHRPLAERRPGVEHELAGDVFRSGHRRDHIRSRPLPPPPGVAVPGTAIHPVSHPLLPVDDSFDVHVARLQQYFPNEKMFVPGVSL